LQEDGKSISQIAEKHGIHPNNIFKWRKQHFEMGIRGFQTTRNDISAKAKDRKIAVLENKVKLKDEVIAELAQELLELKKRTLVFGG
jgi:transposase-like protein